MWDRFYPEKREFRSLFVLVNAVGMVSFVIYGTLATLKTTSFNAAGIAVITFAAAVGVGSALFGLHTSLRFNTAAIVVVFIPGATLRMMICRQEWDLPGF